jgi:NTE family protein
MSIPGVFTPVELDGRRLIDGGVVNNLPVDVVREMGADVVIAVDVRPGLGWRGASDSVMSISAQAIEIAIRSMDKEQAAKADLLIRPKLEGHHAADFKQSPRLIALGAKSARVHSGELGQLAVPEHAYAQWLDRQREGPRQEEVRIDFVEIAGNREVATALIKERIKLEAGDALDLACVQYDLGQIYGLGEFERVRFDLVVTNGQTGVVYRAEEKPWGPNYLHFGLHLEDDFEGNSTYSVLLNFTKRRLNSLGGEWRTDLTLGKERSLFSELYQPVDYAGRFFLAASAEGALVREDLYDGNRRIAEYEIEAVAAGLDAGVQLGRFGEARFGVRRGNVTAEVDVGAEVLPSYDVPIGAMVGQLTIDRLDSVSMPRDGMRLEVAWWGTRDALGGEGEYDKLGIMGGAFASYGDLTFFTEGGVGTALGSEVPDYDQFTLGGFFSLAGYGEGQLRGSYVGTGTLGLYYKFLDLPPGLGRGIYAGVKFDAGNAWQTRKEAELDDLRYAGAVFLGADTALGPMYLGYGRAEQNLDRYYFSLGRPF